VDTTVLAEKVGNIE